MIMKIQSQDMPDSNCIIYIDGSSFVTEISKIQWNGYGYKVCVCQEKYNLKKWPNLSDLPVVLYW